MTTLKEIAENLIGLAEKSTPGPWTAHDNTGCRYVSNGKDGKFAKFDNRICEAVMNLHIGGLEKTSNMDYIASANPETIQKLAKGYLDAMAENEKLKEQNFDLQAFDPFYKNWHLERGLMNEQLKEAREVIEFYSRHRSVADLIAYGDDDESHSWNRARSYLQKYKQGGTE
jgi:hypothetical protein